MASNFDTFANALDALCRHHQVALAATKDRRVSVCDAIEGEEPVTELINRTEERPGRSAVIKRKLPAYFLTVLSAKQTPGFADYSMVMETAYSVASEIPGARVVPIGSPKHVRCWAVIAPQVDQRQASFDVENIVRCSHRLIFGPSHIQSTNSC